MTINAQKIHQFKTCFLLAAWMLSANSSFPAAAFEAETIGVRARLYWTDAEIPSTRRLAPNQSPNVDVKLQNFHVVGNETWFKNEGQTYSRHYVLVLEATVRWEEEADITLRLQSNARVELEIDGEEIATTSGEKTPTVKLKLTPQSRRIKLTQYVNQEPGTLRLDWRGNDDQRFRPLPTELLHTESFYFRPTNATAKRLENSGDRPGNYQKIEGVFPGVDLMTIRAPDTEVPVGGLDVLPDGRLVVVTFDARRLRAPHPQDEPDGELWLYSNVESDDPLQIRPERIADRLFEPCGVCVAGEAIYVSQRDEVTRFDYMPKVARWQPTTVASGWESNDFHALSFGLIHQHKSGPQPGYLFMARGTGLGLKKNPPNHGSVWRIDLARPVGENVEAITGGHRTPNGIGFGPENEIFVTDNQGEFTPANELNHVSPGNFYGFRHQTTAGDEASPFQDQPVTEAAVLMPQDEIANSPTQPLRIPDRWPYTGQMLVGDVRYGGINRVFLEKIKGRWQGAVFRFTQGLEGGVNRLALGKEGSLFVGSIGGDHGSGWNWINRDGEKTYQGLQRLRPNGRKVFDLDHIEVRNDGFCVYFTKPIPQAWLEDSSNYRLSQWRYKATADYGGPKLDVQELEVTRAVPSDDLQSVALTVAGLELGRVVHFVIDPPPIDNEPIWSTEAWYTLWEFP